MNSAVAVIKRLARVIWREEFVRWYWPGIINQVQWGSNLIRKHSIHAGFKKGPAFLYRGQMGNTWITDLRDFLNDEGGPAEMPKQARALVNYLGQIVKAVTTRNGKTLATGVRCRRLRRRKLCPGEIIAFMNEQRTISWSCPVCGNNGLISGWEGAIWDWSVSA